MPLIAWVAYVACAVIVGAASGSVVWLMLAIPSVLFSYTLAAKVVAGYPRTNLEAAERFDRVLVEVGGLDAFRVVVQDQMPSPCTLFRRRRPLVVAAIDFVPAASDEVLRGVAALQHAELRDPRMTKSSKIHRRATFSFVFAAGLLAAFVAPGGSTVLAAGASAGLSTWLATAVAGAWSRTRRAAKVYHESDLTAAGLAGSRAVVADALLAMSSWRATHAAGRSRVARAVYRCLQPAAESWHEADRARRLLGDVD